MREIPQGDNTYLIGEDGKVGEDADLVWFLHKGVSICQMNQT
jgi:hypothetical protein